MSQKIPVTGELQHKLLLEVEERTPDDQGGFATTWVQLGTPWAKAVVATPAQRLYHGKVENTMDIIFIIRAGQRFQLNEQLSDQYRITHRGHLFRVKGLEPLDYSKNFLVIYCQMWGATVTSNLSVFTTGLNDGVHNHDNSIQF